MDDHLLLLFGGEGNSLLSVAHLNSWFQIWSSTDPRCGFKIQLPVVLICRIAARQAVLFVDLLQ